MSYQRRLSRSAYIDPVTHISVHFRSLHTPAPLHLHEYYELELVLSGSGEMDLNGTVYPLTPGTVYLLTPIDFHSVTPTGELTLCNISFDSSTVEPALLLGFLNRRENLIFCQEDMVLTTALAQALQQECKAQDGLARSAREKILSLLLYQVARHRQNAPTMDAAGVENSMQYLFQHFRSPITLEDVASQSGYTPTYFSHLFRALSGQKYVDFLTGLRLNYARMMLLSSKESVTRIGMLSGFSSQSNFFRAFRKETGLSPAQYRKEMG